jgi:nucleoside-diphosphate-sugar epimerase
VYVSYRRQPGAAGWLVLGATGFVGRATLAELNARKRLATGAGHSTSWPNNKNQKSCQAINVFEAEHFRALLRNLRPSILLNAIGHSPDTENSVLRDFYVCTTRIILEAVQSELPSCRLILLGSAAEYGNSPEAGSVETDALNPLSDYGRAKCEQFELASRFAASGLDVITARLFNPIGHGQGAHLFLGALCEQLRRGQRPIRVHNGNHVRDWIDIRDVSRAVVMLGESPNPPPLVNICTGKSHTVSHVANILSGLANVEIKVEPGQMSADVLWHSVGKPQRIFKIGWQPRYHLSESLTGQWHQLL